MTSIRKGSVLENITVTDLSAMGKGFGKHDGKAVFIEKTYPGDVVDVSVKKNKADFIEAEPILFHQKSPDRIEPLCSHFSVCGGCKFQDVQYNAQLRFKHQIVHNAFERIAKVYHIEVAPVIGSEKIREFRNKLEFTFSNKGWLDKKPEVDGESARFPALGFHLPGFYDKVLNVDHCYLQREPSNNIRNALFKFATENDLSFFDLRSQKGLLRNLVIRTTSIGETMALICFHENSEREIFKILEFLKTSFPEITSLQYLINPKKNDAFFDLNIICYSGRDHIIERLEELEFKIGPKSFFQTNTAQALILYTQALKFADLNAEDIVYDLYTGTGSIANFIARSCKKVIGIEQIQEAIDDAQENSRKNNILNTHFFTGDVKNIITTDFIKSYGKPNKIITNPGRAGMHPQVVQTIMQLEPDKIIYISCNPATQARDASILLPGYDIKKIQPVDMFPHTTHIENIVLLEKKQL